MFQPSSVLRVSRRTATVVRSSLFATVSRTSISRAAASGAIHHLCSSCGSCPTPSMWPLHTASRINDDRRMNDSRRMLSKSKGLVDSSNSEAQDELTASNSFSSDDSDDTTTGPPKDDETLGDHLKPEWFKDGMTEMEKEDFDPYLVFKIGALKRNPDLLTSAQKFLKVNLELFLKTGRVSFSSDDSDDTTTGPPKDDETLGDYWKKIEEWLEDRVTEERKKGIKLQPIYSLKTDSEHLQVYQKYFKMDLEHFIKTGFVIPYNNSPSAVARVAVVDYEIENITMSYKRDYFAFKDRVEELFQWRTSKTDTFMAPYFPIIQSSGTGKTKLMHEYKKEMLDNINVHCELILCHDGNPEKILPGGNSRVFSMTLEVDKFSTNDQGRENLWNMLDDLVDKTSKEKVVLLFDESQHLIKKSDGWHFRSIRWWLRSKRGKADVVCVFAGTNTGLANYFAEPGPSTSSRDASFKYNTGNRLYPPFCEITTTGLVSRTDGSKFGYIGSTAQNSLLQAKKIRKLTEFDVAVQYGRPLFARMHLNGELEGALGNILLRMAGGPRDEKIEDIKSLQQDFSILAARLQMGQVSFDFASQQVASGYAHLTHFDPENAAVAEIAYLPEPLCAWLAMTLMIEGCNLLKKAGGFKLPSSQHASVWSEKAIKIYSSALCRPAKGDVGEVAAAFYMLACGDELRHEQSKELTELSVPLEKWVAKLQGNRGGTSGGGFTSEGATINFIQVCRNYLRHSLNEMQDSELIKHWYQSGRASYAYAGCPGYDLLIPVRYETKDEGVQYCPMLVSVKNRLLVSKQERKNAFDAMRNVFEKAGVETGVCMLFLIGLEEPSTEEPSSFQFVNGNITTVEIEVPMEDPFGATNIAWCPICAGGEKTEVMASHTELALAPQTNFTRLLRSNTKKRDPSRKFLDDIVEYYGEKLV